MVQFTKVNGLADSDTALELKPGLMVPNIKVNGETTKLTAGAFSTT